MKTPFAVVLVVLSSFVLGFFARGLIPAHPNVAAPKASLTAPVVNDPTLVPGSTVRDAERVEVSRDSGVVTLKQGVNFSDEVSRQDHPARNVYYMDNPENRARRLEHMREMLAEFFRINGIDAGSGEEIVQKLVEVDIETTAKMAQLEATLDPDAPGVKSGAALFENKEFLRLEEDRIARRRKIFGAHYDAFREYKATYQHQSVLNSFSSFLDTPLNITTRDELLRILIEEAPEVRAPHSSPSTSDEMSLTLQSRLAAVESRNAAVKNRARSYLTPSEFELFARTLEIEAERLELSIKLMELSRE